MPRASAETLTDDSSDDSADENRADDDPAGATAAVRTRRIRRIAREVLGYETFRPGQEEAMQAVVGGRDTLAVLPSGAGKTAIYQVAGQLLGGEEGVVVVLVTGALDLVTR